MFSFLVSAGNKIKEAYQDFASVDSDEMGKLNAKNIPGLEVQWTMEGLEKYNSCTRISSYHNHEIGVLYNLKYGGLGARVLLKSSPITQLTGSLRFLGDIYGVTLMGVVDFDRHKLHKWGVGVNLIARNQSAQIKLDADKMVISTRQGIFHPRVVGLSECNLVYKNPSLKSTLALGIEWRFHSRSTFQVMFSQRRSPTFAVQYQGSSPLVVKVYGDVFNTRSSIYGDVFDNRIGVSVSFHPSSFY